MESRCRSFGVLYLLLTVILGAFGAHAVKEKLSATDLEIYKTAVHYLMITGFALLLLAPRVASLSESKKIMIFSAQALIGGSLIFSGSLFILIATGVRQWGAVTPIGGMGLILGLGAWALAEKKNKDKKRP